MGRRRGAGTRFRATQHTAAVLLPALGLAAVSGAAQADDFSLFGLQGDFNVQATYSVAARLHDADKRLVDSVGGPRIPVPEFLKYPESNNYDDGNRNFKKGSLINNRLSLLGEVGLTWNDYGVFFRGDTFYDQVYKSKNDNTSPESISNTHFKYNHFTDSASFYDGNRFRLLDAYAYANWTFGDEMALGLKIGQHVAAWGESLFFSGVALTQGPADATKAAVPGADVKSILLPVNQVSMNFALNNQLTLLGQYKFEFKPFELNPVGEFYSPADVVGPGAEFIYGIRNPFQPDALSRADLGNGATYGQALNTVLKLAFPGLADNQIAQALEGLAGGLNLPGVLNLPLSGVSLPGTSPAGINVQRIHDTKPSRWGQWGAGVRWQATPTTNFGYYHLRMHSQTPGPVQNYGYATLVGPVVEGGTPLVTTADLALKVPVTYSIRYFDAVRTDAMSMSTNLFGANVGMELLWRENVPVLVDVDAGVLGPVPTPTRARIAQVDLNGLYLWGPGPFWDSIVLVGDLGYISVQDVNPVSGPDPNITSTDLTNTKDSAAYQFLAIVEKRNVFNGWDLSMPIVWGDVIVGQSSYLSGFGALFGEDNSVASVGVNFTYLLKLTVGVNWAGYFGHPDLNHNPYADRDNVGINVTYRF